MDKISEVILKYRCCICKSPLSVPPIMTTNASNSSEELYKCGRCKDFKHRPTVLPAQHNGRQNMYSGTGYYYNQPVQSNEPPFYRASLYESVAGHLSFPCRYNQCNEKVAWGAVERHETNCPQRTICCPLFDTGCSKEIKMNELVQHFKNTHPASVKNIGTAFKAQKQSNSMFLLAMENAYFIVYILNGGGHKGKLTFSSSYDGGRIAVLSTQSNGYAKFNVKLLFAKNKNFSVMFESLPIISFQENSHCYMCVSGRCERPHHAFSRQNRQSQIDLNSFTSSLGNNFFNLPNYHDELRFLITPISNTKEEDNNKVDQVGLQADVHEGHVLAKCYVVQALKKALKCPCCFMLMGATIHTCASGHSICAECKIRLQTCPLCRKPFGNSRNFVLQELAAEVELPCTYDDLGCTFVGKSPDMRQHEAECVYMHGIY